MEQLVRNCVMAIIGVILMVTILGSTIGLVGDAGNVVNQTGYTGSSLFASNGILPLIVLMGALVGIVGLAFTLNKHKS